MALRSLGPNVANFGFLNAGLDRRSADDLVDLPEVGEFDDCETLTDRELGVADAARL